MNNVNHQPISWDDYFMNKAILASMRSKDPSTRVGAVLVNEDNRSVGDGYNGFPNGCSDEDFPWDREGSFLETKYAYVIHAEENAILNCTSSLKGARIYVTLFPCNECAKKIIQTGIKEVVYLEDKYAETDSVRASKKMFEATGVKMRQLRMEQQIQMVSTTQPAI